MTDSKSSQMKRIANEIADLIPDLNRLAKEGKPIVAAVQQTIEAVDRGETSAANPDITERLDRVIKLLEELDADREIRLESFGYEEVLRELGTPQSQIGKEAYRKGLQPEHYIAQMTGSAFVGTSDSRAGNWRWIRMVKD
jgi:hypothetical protein